MNFISSHFIIDNWRSLKSQYRELFEPARRPKLELDFRINQFARWALGQWALGRVTHVKIAISNGFPINKIKLLSNALITINKGNEG